MIGNVSFKRIQTRTVEQTQSITLSLSPRHTVWQRNNSEGQESANVLNPLCSLCTLYTVQITQNARTELL